MRYFMNKLVKLKFSSIMQYHIKLEERTLKYKNIKYIKSQFLLLSKILSFSTTFATICTIQEKFSFILQRVTLLSFLQD